MSPPLGRLLLAAALSVAGGCSRRPAPADAAERAATPSGASTVAASVDRCGREALFPLAEPPFGVRSCAALKNSLPPGAVLACWDGDDGVAILAVDGPSKLSPFLQDAKGRSRLGNAYVVTSEERIHPSPGWALDRIDQSEASPGSGVFTVANGGDRARIWVVDSGVAEVPELAGRVEPRIRIVACGAEATCTKHGTHVATAAAGADHGVARQAVVKPVDVVDARAEACATDLVRAFRAIGDALPSADGFADVVNVSLELLSTCAEEGDVVCDQLDVELDRLGAAGAVVVVAAGNDGADAGHYGLSRNEGVLVVGGFDKNETLQGRGGERVDVLAPCNDVDVSDTTGAPDTGRNTSIAAALVTGFAAVVRTEGGEADSAEEAARVHDEIKAWASEGRFSKRADLPITSRVLCTRIGGGCPRTTP